VVTNYRHVVFQAMACRCELVLPTETAESSIQATLAEVRRIEHKYSRYRSDSIVSRINAAAGIADIEIDQETYNLLSYARTCFELSGGLFDITSGVLRRAWQFPKAEVTEQTTFRIPTQRALDLLLALIDFSKLSFSATHARLQRAGMELDFGGFGKEYAVDRAAFVLRAHGVRSGLVNLGGDVAAIGDKHVYASSEAQVLKQRSDSTEQVLKQRSGSTEQITHIAWRVGIQHPREMQQSFSTELARDHAIATSGDYERYFELEGKRYCHILNPKTGLSVAHAQSISVIAPSCLAAGSISTIAMLCEAQGLDFLRAQNLAFLWIGPDGRLISS
jgi:FAD:protein FMN transferase